jgi:hypothetical protein
MMLSAARRSLSATAAMRRPAVFLGPVDRCFSDEGPKQAIRKVKKKEKKSKRETGRPRDLEIILASLDAIKTKEPKPSEEEEERRAEIRRAYTIGKFQQHNQENHELACKLRFKKHAMKMLPKDSQLKKKAMEIDTAGPPRWRNIPAWTPPIPNFKPKDFMNVEE